MMISIHASRGGSDVDTFCIPSKRLNISIHASRGGSDTGLYGLFYIDSDISIHASRGGSDSVCLPFRGRPVEISIHASRGGSDKCDKSYVEVFSQFQSTLPVGEATAQQAQEQEAEKYFNPRFPWGKRLRLLELRAPNPYFNPRFPWGKRPRQPWRATVSA